MGNWFGHRRLAGIALGAMLSCASSAFAQDAQPSPSLTGIPDIDFSLPVRPVENPGTPTEGRSLRPATPSEPEPATTPTASAAVANPSGVSERRAPPVPAQPAQTVRAEPSPSAPAAPEVGSEPLAAEETTPDRGTAQPFDVSTVAGKANAAGSALPLWPLGLAAFAAVAWFVFRRRRRGRESGEALVPEDPALVSLDLEADMELAPEPSPPPSVPAPAVAEPVAPPPAPAPEAHPALRVKVPEPVPAAPPGPPAPPVARYDAFGRPIVARPSVPKPPPKPAPKPRAKIVRYDAMGLPIRD
ncbi:MAG: hypothetical protein KDE25_12340 [Novosphingobium sp.]|nr:hypothetical protein [Novosphingobium sp.]